MIANETQLWKVNVIQFSIAFVLNQLSNTQLSCKSNSQIKHRNMVDL